MGPRSTSSMRYPAKARKNKLLPAGEKGLALGSTPAMSSSRAVNRVKSVSRIDDLPLRFAEGQFVGLRVDPVEVGLRRLAGRRCGLGWHGVIADETVDLVGIAENQGNAVDRKSVGEGRRGSVRVDLGGRRIIKKKKKY